MTTSDFHREGAGPPLVPLHGIATGRDAAASACALSPAGFWTRMERRWCQMTSLGLVAYLRAACGGGRDPRHGERCVAPTAARLG